MAKKIVTPVEVQASVKGDESVKSFRAQLKEAQQEAFRLAQALGQTSPEAVKAAEKVAELKDQMDDYNATVASIHPDKFEVIAKTVGTMANGFAAAQGAAALLGSESEDLQKAMVRVQGAMAFAQGIAGLKDIQFMFVGIRTAIMTQVIPAFQSMGSALIATGIGAGIVAIGAALAVFADKVSKARKAGEKYREELKRMETAQEEMRARLESSIQGMDIGDEIQLLRQRLSGQIKTEEEFEIKRLEMLQNTYRAMADQHKAGSDERLAFLNASTSAGLKIEKLKLEQQLRQQEEAAERSNKIVKNTSETVVKEKEIELQMLEEMDRRSIKLADETNKQKRTRIKEQQDFEKKTAIDNVKLQEDIAKVQEEWEKKRLETQKQYRQNAIDLAVESAAAMIDLLNVLTSNGNARTEEERKKEFERQKKYQIAATMVSTFAAAQKAYQSQLTITPDSPIRAAIAAAIAVTSGLARVAAIKKQQYNGGGPTGSNQPGNLPGGGNIPAPSFASSTLGGGTQFAGSFDNRVYVTEGDITGTQRRVRQNRGVSVI